MYLKLCSPWLEALQCLLCGWTVSCISLQPHLTSSHPICGHVSCLAISWNTSVALSQLWVFSFAGPLPWNIPFWSLPGWPLLLKLTSLFKCYLLREALSVLAVFFFFNTSLTSHQEKFLCSTNLYLFYILVSYLSFPCWLIRMEHCLSSSSSDFIVFITFPRNLCLFATSVNTHAV